MSAPNIGLYQLSTIAQELEGMMHGTTLNQVTNLFGCYNRAARRIIHDVDPQETKVIETFGKVYDGVWDYPITASLKGNKIIDLFPQANRQLKDNFTQVYNKTFDLYKGYSIVPDFTPRYSGAVRTIRINATNLQTGIQINSADSYNGNGEWTAVQNVSDITNNPQLTTNGGSGLVQFNIDQTGVPGTEAVIQNSTFASIDLSAQFNNADEFFAFYIPNASGITSIKYRFGTDSANYYDSGALTEQMLEQPFNDGWNSMKKLWSEFTTVGSPDPSNIAYIQIRITYDGVLQTQVLLNQFWSRLGVIFDIEFYSKYFFRDSSGTFKENATSENDYVNLDTDYINLFLFASFAEIVQQVQGSDALFFDASQAEQRYQEALSMYKNTYKSEVIKPKAAYYRIPRAGYGRFYRGGNKT